VIARSLLQRVTLAALSLLWVVGVAGRVHAQPAGAAPAPTAVAPSDKADKADKAAAPVPAAVTPEEVAAKRAAQQDAIRRALEAGGMRVAPGGQAISPGGSVVAPPGAAGAAARPAAPAIAAKPDPNAKSSTTSIHGDTTQGNSPLLALLFWVFAAVCVGGAMFVVTRANLITAVMGMVATFLGIAAVYMMLYASFLAVVQILVYAGAIMVLFVFVIMVLNRPEDEPFSRSGKVAKGLAAAGMAYMLLRLMMVVWKVTPPNPGVAKNAPAAVNIGVGSTPELVEWGSTKAVGASLFTNYLFLFEAISILLLIAVVGAIAIARPLDPDIESPGDGEGGGGGADGLTRPTAH
jgi:NADH-quinone oxidoreductase subunit J